MKIHQWFIPNRKNKFHPVALRSTGLIVFLAIFIAIPFLYNITTARQFKVLGYATNVTIDGVYSASNQERINNGLTPLSLNSALNSAALAKANDMIADNYWAHIAPDGTSPWAFISASGYQYTAAGENLAKDFNTSSGVVAGWMGSPTHAANILNSSYKDVGYAVVNGVLLGSGTTLVVAMYGARSEPVVAATVKETTTDQSEKQATETTDATTETDNSIGSVAGMAILLPIKTYDSFNWGQKASIVLICTLILLFIMKHTMVWREQKRGLKHIWLRSHPLGQAAMLTVVLIFTLASGVGVVL